ncbi:DMT family transporter [Sneathiella marina]|uniref:DMT family transporter n=1 Tax=Sneathiella marina TaxID=2950108 RepID=A0ABY4W3L9_9PROT|nr:DMT family transporter [Sneathiella marina]USG61776.1 DMT family transporter [Sneathiella marina]
MISTQKPALAIALMVLAMLLVPVMDGTAKLLMQDFDVVQVVWARYAFHFLTLIPLLAMSGQIKLSIPTNIRLQLVRAAFLLGDTFLFFAALALIPLANGKAVFFVAPLVMTALSPLILKEKVGRRRWTAVAIGFLGALVILRPDVQGISWGYALALASAVLYALYLLYTRKLAKSSPPMVTLLVTAIFGTVIMSVAVPFYWTAPDLTGWLLMLAMGALGTVSHYLIIKAFEWGEMPMLAPFTYAEIVSASLFGLMVFGQFPDLWTWIGITIVIVSGIYISRREFKRN